MRAEVPEVRPRGPEAEAQRRGGGGGGGGRRRGGGGGGGDVGSDVGCDVGGDVGGDVSDADGAGAGGLGQQGGGGAGARRARAQQPPRHLRHAAGARLRPRPHGAAPPGGGAGAGGRGPAGGRAAAPRRRRRRLHPRPRHGGAAGGGGGGGADAGAALGAAPAGRQPLRGAHRDGAPAGPRPRPPRALRQRRQHPGHRLLAPALPHLRRDAGHRRGQLPGPLRPRAQDLQRPQPRLQHRAAGQEGDQAGGAALRGEGHGRLLLGAAVARRGGGPPAPGHRRGHRGGPLLLPAGDGVRHAGGGDGARHGPDPGARAAAGGRGRLQPAPPGDAAGDVRRPRGPALRQRREVLRGQRRHDRPGRLGDAADGAGDRHRPLRGHPEVPHGRGGGDVAGLSRPRPRWPRPQ